MPNVQGETYRLDVPLDASTIEDRDSSLKVRVLLVRDDKPLTSQLVKLDRKGHGVASFKLSGKPGNLEVYLGPEAVEDGDLLKKDTVTNRISARLWRGENQLKLKPIVIPYYYWNYWLLWCRTFVITGKVSCPDGSPVPGATVCAYDVDAFWWWSSKQKVASATTNADGIFKMKFTWCCGWRPWWWWHWRQWYLNPRLADLIQPHLQDAVELGLPTIPKPKPDPGIFERVLERDITSEFKLPKHTINMERVNLAGELSLTRVEQPKLNPESLTRLRTPLLQKLPNIEALKRYHLWPWYPFYPWRDCHPDLIFRVTQDCGDGVVTLLDEDYLDARWNVNTYEHVNLTVSDDACCLADPPDDIEGYCALLTDVCHVVINDIGGNPGALPAPLGYANPGVVSNTGDRPFGGVVKIQGDVGDEVDYYDFEFLDTSGGGWIPVPDTAMGGFSRRWYQPLTTTFQNVPFRHSIDNRIVYESRQHYEANSGLNFGVDTFWTGLELKTLMPWATNNPFLNGTYRLRLRGYRLNAAGNLVDQEVLPICSTQTPNGLVLRIDNRRVGLGSGHPLPGTDPDRPCGPGTVHTCTLEPDTAFIGVRIRKADGTAVSVEACADTKIVAGDRLEVDFVAYDPEGHLKNYAITSHYGLSSVVNLLTAPTGILTPIPAGGLGVAGALQVGPDYLSARSQIPGGALPPTWTGGAIRLSIDAQVAFPTTCCYQLKLRAWKRTLVNCSNNQFHNTSEISFMVAT